MRCALLVLSLLAGCQRAEPRTNMKGWELYCRQDEGEGEVAFVLLLGTNRLKGADEVARAEAVLGQKGLRRLLGTLARGQTVLCRTPVDAPADGPYFVPWSNTDLGRMIVAEAKRRGITVHMQDW